MPTRDTPWPTGTPCWVDYSAQDIGAARTFYESLFGWQFEGGDSEYGEYWMGLVDGRPAAGMMPRPGDDVPPSWTVYLATDDAAATCAAVTAAGGTVAVPPMQVGPSGTMAVAMDPQGNVFGLWQAGEHIGESVFNQPGTVTWNEAAVEDPVAARAFYGTVFGFGWTEVPGAQGYTVFTRDGDRPLGGLGGLQPGGARGWLTCFAAPSADEVVRRTEAAGGKVVSPAMDTEFGRIAVLSDPWGAPFQVMSEVASG